MVETENPRELTALLQPFMDLVRWDVHAVYSLDYDEEIQRLQQVVQQ